jgi:toxin ParE1/3/4
VKVRFRREAATEVRHARDWYAARDTELGDRLVAAVDAAVERVAGRPLSFPVVALVPTARRAQLRNFPFLLVFRVLPGDVIEVLALAHMRRRPYYWRRRAR